MLPAELGRGADPAQVLFDDLTLEFEAELSLFSHDKILSALSGLKILSDSLTHCPNGGGQFISMSGLELAIGKKLTTIIANKFGTKVIERWTRYRAEKFFEGFVESLSEELNTSIKSTEADAALDKILDDDVKSEVLFDAYCTVCFAKSKTIGPKIVGILTGYLVAEGRKTSIEEDFVFRAAEALSDADLIELFKEFRKRAKDADECKDEKKYAHWEGDSIVVPWNQEVQDCAWPHSRKAEIDISPLNLGEVFGYWAAHAEQLGLLSCRIAQRQFEYKEDSDRHIDEDGVLTIYTSTITFESPCKRLSELIGRCLGKSKIDTGPDK